MIIVDETLLAARSQALRLLECAAKSSEQIRQGLAKQNYPPAIIETVVADLERAGLLDDADFASEYLYFRTRKKGQSRALLRQELAAKGVDSAHIQAALDTLPQEYEHESALSFARSKAAGLGKLDPAVAKKRLWAALARRGYENTVASAVVDEVILEMYSYHDGF